MRLIVLCLTVLLALPTVAAAQGREWIGTGRLFSNDYLGDGRDRWRSGSLSYSHIRGRTPFAGIPQTYGEILEFRFRTDIIAPAGGSDFPGDRPYVGATSLGLFTHYAEDDLIFAFGAEITAIGPQTRLSAFQREFHDRFDISQSPFIDQELDDDILFSASGEVAKIYQLSDTVTLRPFAGALVGVEDLVRVGGDLRISSYGHNNLLLRDLTTGQLYPGTRNDGTGWAFTFGGDIAYVTDSAFLPADRTAGIAQTRTRLRSGIGYTFASGTNLFYGLTYLGPEFEGQPEGQLLGSLRLDFNF